MGEMMVNGALIPRSEATAPALDRGLLYGWGLFETIRVQRSRPLWIEQHLARLDESARRLRIELPFDCPEIARQAASLAESCESRRARLRITLTAGTASGPPQLFMECTPLPDEEEQPISVSLEGRHPRSWIPGMKTLCHLPFLQAHRQALLRGFDDVILCFLDEAVETSRANLFIVDRDGLVTPSLESGCLPGVGRAQVIAEALREGIPVQERRLPVSELMQAPGAFVASALRGVLPIRRIAGTDLEIPGLVFDLARRYEEACAEAVR